VTHERGARPYLIPGDGSNAVGALGYAAVVSELVTQANEQGLHIDRLMHATGSTGTQAGFVAGLHATGSPVCMLGIGVRQPKGTQEANVQRLAQATAAHRGADRPVPADAVETKCDYVGAGYGRPTPGMVEAVQMVARLEGISWTWCTPGRHGRVNRPGPKGCLHGWRERCVPAYGQCVGAVWLCRFLQWTRCQLIVSKQTGAKPLAKSRPAMSECLLQAGVPVGQEH